MSDAQFVNTLSGINKSKHVKKPGAFVKHFLWQIRKLFNLFPFEITVSNSKIIAEDKNCGVCALANCMGMYDYNIMNLIKLLSERETYFFDVGANIGLYSLLAAENSNVNVISFEPHPKTFRQLERNINLNKRQNIKTFNVALGKEEGEIQFTDFPESSINRIANESDKNTITIKVRRGSKICDELNLIPSFIKVDVEGFEFDVLQGFGEKLAGIKLIILEFGELNLRNHNKISMFMKQNNFAGPFNFSDRDMSFTHKLRKTEENVVFVNENFRPYFEKNYRIIFK